MDLEKLSKQIQKPVLPEEDILQKFNDIIQILSAVESKGDKLSEQSKAMQNTIISIDKKYEQALFKINVRMTNYEDSTKAINTISGEIADINRQIKYATSHGKYADSFLRRLFIPSSRLFSFSSSSADAACAFAAAFSCAFLSCSVSFPSISRVSRLSSRCSSFSSQGFG